MNYSSINSDISSVFYTLNAILLNLYCISLLSQLRRHTGGSRYPGFLYRRDWIPAFAGMTAKGIQILNETYRRAVLSKLDTHDYIC